MNDRHAGSRLGAASRSTLRIVRRLARNPAIRTEAVILLVLLILHLIPETIKDPLNPSTLLLIGGSYLTAVGGMVLFTRLWTLRGASILATLQGDAVLYLGTGLAGFGIAWQTGLLLDFVRASFVVGGPMLVWGTVGLVRTWISEHRRHEEIIDDEVPVMPP